MRKTHITLITVISLISVVMLQLFWLTNTYMLLAEDTHQKFNELFGEAMHRELFNRMYKLDVPDGTHLPITFISAETGKKRMEEIELQEAVANLGSPFCIDKLDSIYNLLLVENNISTPYRLFIYGENDSLIYSQGEDKLSRWGIFNTQTIGITSNPYRKAGATLIDLHKSIFANMGLLLAGSLIIMIFISYCIYYQIRINIRQNRLVELQKDFSYAMIHDMKNPLTSIIMGVNTLMSGSLDQKPERKQKTFTIVQDEAYHLLTLTNKILTIAKLEQSKLSLKKSTMELTPIVADLIEKFQAKATKEIHFNVDLREKFVYADEEYLKEVISNLIDNSIKYSKEPVTIDIYSSIIDGYVDISVKDNGLGISPKDQAKVFEKFERASAVKRTGKDGATGFGLGLNYVLQVIEAHEGKVKINSIEGKYCIVTISLPQLTQVL